MQNSRQLSRIFSGVLESFVRPQQDQSHFATVFGDYYVGSHGMSIPHMGMLDKLRSYLSRQVLHIELVRNEYSRCSFLTDAVHCKYLYLQHLGVPYGKAFSSGVKTTLALTCNPSVWEKTSKKKRSNVASIQPLQQLKTTYSQRVKAFASLTPLIWCDQ
jgi:hypothetical protein